MMTVVRSLAVALVCLACADAENQRDAVARDTSSDRADTLSDSLRVSTPPPEVPSQPFDSSFEHYIQTVPEEKLDSIPMPRTPG